MPSGGGSFGGGGGGGGGGGFSGGGFSSHSYHHSSYHHHHHHYYGGGGSYRGGKSSPLSCCFYISFGIVICVIIVMIVLMVRFTSNVNTSGDTYYSPGDSRLIELNTLFCDKVKLSESSPRTDAELYLLTKNEIPPITDRNNFTIDSDFTIQRNEYQFWQYHLYPNSNVSISACISAGSSVTLYVIKGTDNYNNWLSDGSSTYSRQNVFISQLCSGSTRGGTTLNVNREDEWYFAFANRGSQSSVLSAQLTFERFQYTTNTLSQASHTCSTTANGECSLDVKFRSNRKYALIVTSIPEDTVDWGENVDVNWKCDRNHGGYFLVIGVPIFGLLFLIIFTILVFVGGLFIYLKKEDITKKVRSWRSSDPQVLTTSFTSSATDYSRPEPEPEPKAEEETKEFDPRIEPPPPYEYASSS